jgi:exosome complex component CSL4
MSLPPLAIPGQLIATANKFAPGPGTFQATSSITASILGAPSSQKNTTTPKSSKIVTITLPSGTTHLPQLNATVYARVTRIERPQARCEILVVADTVASQPLRAILRSQDVRATEKDKVKLVECFHVGDIIRATVIGLGDQTGYYLSTAGNDFGVVMAWSEAGNGCVPISWCEVRDSETGVKEARKVAKPV